MQTAAADLAALLPLALNSCLMPPPATSTPTQPPPEVRSGLVIFVYPSFDSSACSLPYPVDFSALSTETLWYGDAASPPPSYPSAAAADLLFHGDRLEAPHGILDVGSHLLPPDTVNPTPPAISPAPADGYASSVPFAMDHLYVVRTAEGYYVAFLNHCNYIGGYDRYAFYWSYSSDTSRELHIPADLWVTCSHSLW